MGASFVIAGRTFRRRSVIKLSLEERAALDLDGFVVLARAVEWPLPDRAALMDRAYVDHAGTDIWGPGPYLKVPNVGPGDADEVVNRVFCPWGYPPDPVRASSGKLRMRLEQVELVQVAPAAWEWRLKARAA